MGKHVETKMLLIFGFILSISYSVEFEGKKGVAIQRNNEVRILKNTSIAVNFGRSLMLERKHLDIQYNKKGKCQITVLQNNRDASTVGMLIPSVFPCMFKPNSVYYQHYGSMRRSVEVINLQVRFDTDKKTTVTPFTLTIHVGLYQPFEILKNVENLFVDEVGGLSEPLSTNVISFRYNNKKQKCKVRFLPINKGPPYYGSLINSSGLNVAMKYRDISCSDFLKGSIRYVHRRSERSANRDYLPLVIEVYDKETTHMEKQEYVQVPVRIRRAPDNQPPIVNYNEATYSIQVDQLVLTALTPTILKVEDRETDPDDIMFNITQVYKDTDGYLVHTDDPTVPVRTFYQKDIEELKIAFKASDNLSTSQRMQQIWMEAIDSHSASSAPFYIIVIIKPTNSFTPQVIRNEKLTMFEGQSRAITREFLNIRDPDNESEVTIVVTNGLNNGRLEMLGARVDQFTIKDIDAGAVRYVHDGSDTYTDNIVFRISDGRNTLEILFIVLIISQDDQPPRLKYNTGLTLEEGGLETIDQFHLSSTDVDSDDTKVKYQIVRFPTTGNIVYRQASIPKDLKTLDEGWTFIDGMFERNISEFHQTDIILKKIFYRHSGNEQFYDFFTFYLLDEVPNQSGLKTFIINIKSEDDLSPVLQKGCPLQLNTEEGQPVAFSKQSLSYVDGDSVDSKLIYTITHPPYFSDSLQSSPAGNIVAAHNHSKVLDSFTQKHVNHFKVYFIPPDVEIGNVSRTILFHFNVQDTNGNSAWNQVFKIVVLPVNNKPPVFTTSVLMLNQGTRKNITESHLNAFDEDTNSSDVMFLLSRQPRHGLVVCNGSKLQLGEAVSVKDVARKHLQYVNDGMESGNDDVKFMISDQLHMVPAELQIEILPAKINTLTINILQSTLSVQENGIVRITDTIMEPSDETDDISKITIKVNKKPKFGVIENQGLQTDTFTWNDVATGKIAYRHSSGEIGIFDKHDNVSFILSNTSKDIVVDGTLYGGIFLDINIIAVNSQPPVLTEPLIVNVTEGGRSPLKINITDEDTDMSDITCVVTKEPVYGFLENVTPLKGSEIRRDDIKVTSFTGYEVQQQSVNYVQSRHKRIEPSLDSFNIRCSDGNNTSSDVIVHVTISLVNDEAPIIFVQDPIVCIEDDLVLFDLSKINPYDRDLPKDVLTITVIEQPKNGELMLQKMTGIEVARTFSYEDLSGTAETTVMYQHKGTETTTDQFILSVSDGRHTVNKTININIVAMDDERPQLVVNTGLHIERLETKIITSRNLKAEDLDSEDSQLIFIVMMESIFGKLQKLISVGKYEDLHRGSNFTQDDIDHKRIRYVHLNLKGGERDSVRLDVTDGQNRLINQIFHIVIAAEDFILPEVVNKGIELPENSRKILTTDMLSASDLNSPDEELEFIVTKTPLRGFLEHASHDGVPLTRFTQLDLASNKISYVHTSTDELKTDHFEFEVTDGHNKVYRTFRITISDVDNKKPVLHTSELLAYEGQDKIISPFELSAQDNDTDREKIIFTIHQHPKYGNLVFAGNRRTYRFTQSDIDNNRIAYRNLQWTRTLKDQFSVTVSDGTHTEFFYPAGTIRKSPVVVPIQLLVSDKKAPQLITNNIGSILHKRHGRTFFRFSIEHLEAVDSHSAIDSITYVVTTPPTDGKLINVKDKSKIIDTFTQSDINKRLVEYVLNKDSNATSDVFLFDVSDDSNNTLKEQSFNFHWARVCAADYYANALETDGTIELSFKRYGNLQNDAFSTVNVRNLDKYKGLLETEQILHWKAGSQYATLNLTIIDNKVYEKSKTAMVSLRNGVNVLIGHQCNMHVEISDPEDEAVAFLSKPSIKVSESVGILEIPVKRTGDTRGITSVYCITNSGTAVGTQPKSVSSYHDFVSRKKNQESSLVTFEENEVMKFCGITILDDTLYEDAETFQVQLLPHFGGRIDPNSQNASVVIERDTKDEPVFMLEKILYTVAENVGIARVVVQRRCKDMDLYSYVQIATQQAFPVSAEANKDYKPLARMLEFKPGATFMEVEIEIIDDLHRPRVEGKETFFLALHGPRNGRIDQSMSKTTIEIEDFDLDKPKLHFKERTYRVNEDIGTVTIPIIRTGDPLKEVSVRCYTRQKSATVAEDFVERKRDDESLIKFERKQTEKNCEVQIVDDEKFEPDESFNVFIEIEDSNNNIAEVQSFNRSVVTIIDNDEPIVQFSSKKYFALEPTWKERQTTFRVTLLRTGDKTKRSRVSVISKDGSAMAGIHYKPIANDLIFDFNISEVTLNVTIYHVPSISVRLAFTLLLATDVEDSITKVKSKRAIISIEEKNVHKYPATFPLNPVVVSLADYGNTRKDRTHPVNGYPLICVTACDPHSPHYTKTRAICEQEHIVNQNTTYRWQIRHRDGGSLSTNRFTDITSKLFFTRTNRITLDSVYFTAKSQIRCISRAYSKDGGFGLESTSEPIQISDTEGICKPRNADVQRSTQFSAQASYVTSRDKKHRNLIHVKLLIPHYDGMVPVISTKQLSNIHSVLGSGIARTTDHTCSNLVDNEELLTNFGFLTSLSKDSVYSSQPFQYDANLRGNRTVNFYQHLNLDSCLWTFESYYNINELVTKCGAKMMTNGGEAETAVQSSLVIRIPLYVSYLFRSGPENEFVNYDHQTSIRLTAVYNTGALWDNGIELLSNGKLSGELYPTKIVVLQKDRRLMLKFKTKARFRGVFLPETKDGKLISQVSSPDQPSLTFTLKHIRSEPTFDEPQQEWQMTSDLAVRDYSGTYTFKLIPCVVETGLKKFIWPPNCFPEDFVEFKLPLSIHQISQPVEASFTLNTLFFVVKNEEQFLDRSFQPNQLSPNDVSFEEGDTIFGRVLIDSVSSVAKPYRVRLDKVFLCAGKDGYIPEFTPDKEKYGCLIESEGLMHRLKILDRSNPNTQDTDFWEIPFNASFQSNHLRDRQSDGFRMDSTPLFKDPNGRTWFLHVIYKVKVKKRNRKVGNQRSKRTTEYLETILQHSFSPVHDTEGAAEQNNRARRTVGSENQLNRDLRSIGHKKGTNLRMLTLVKSSGENSSRRSQEDISSASNRNVKRIENSPGVNKTLLIAVIISVCLLLLIIVVIIIIYKRTRVKAASDSNHDNNNNSNNNNNNRAADI